MEEFKETINELISRITGLEAEVAALRSENQQLKNQLVYTTKLAKTGSPIVPEIERIETCNELIQYNSQQESYDELSRQFK